MGQVIMTDLQWRDGRRLPWAALTLLGLGGDPEELVSVAAEPALAASEQEGHPRGGATEPEAQPHVGGRRLVGERASARKKARRA